MEAKAISKKAGAPAPKPKIKRKYSEVQLGDYLIGSQVWIRDNKKEELYTLATVKKIEGTTLTVEIDGGVTKDVQQDECLNANVGVTPETCNDLSKLPHANEAAALQIIRDRYLKDQIYTYAGRLLIAMNPFKLIPGLYDSSCITRYQNSDTSRGFPIDLPPHTYSIAQLAMDYLRINKENQSCIVSGESGAGKTETARQLMQYFATDKQGKGGSKIQDIILGANPVLEAIGNAKTLRNNNSSRFGRFVKLDVSPTGGIRGGIINNYMLELSRIEFQSKGERNYHIFYQLIKGLNNNDKNNCLFKNIHEYEFLNKSDCYEVDTVDDLKEFNEVQQQLDQLFTKEEKLAYFQILSAVLLCGNIDFVNVQAMGTDKAAKLRNETEFEQVATLLGVNKSSMLEALTINTVEVRGNIIKSPLSAEQALVMCRSMAKEIYSVLFDFIVESFNQKIQFDHENKVWIGILDIYGFEFFEKNSYEQFLINYANERLQQFFIQQVFQAEKAEYEAEGIDHSMIVYSDNAAVLEVFDKPKAGIFAFLEEQCLLQTGTSESFTAACHKNIKSENYEVPKGDARLNFRIIHTAAPVLYTTTEFVPKNKMRLPNELISLFKGSNNKIMNKSFINIDIPDNKNMKGKFVGSKFQKSMNHLMNTLKSSRAHFCRCIKPNQLKKPRIFETENTLNQLISLSVLEAVSIIHKGFAYKSSFIDFFNDNHILFKVLGANLDGGDAKTATLKILDILGINKEDYQLGETKIFLRKKGWLIIDQYFRSIMNNLKPLIIYLQSIYRAIKARDQYKKFSSRVIRLQSLIRRYDVRKTQIKKKELLFLFTGAVYTIKLCLFQRRRVLAAIQIQKVFRGYRARKQTAATMRKAKLGKLIGQTRRITFAGVTGLRWRRLAHKRKEEHAAIIIQGLIKIIRAKKELNKLKKEKIEENAAILIQTIWRGYVARLRLALMKYLTPYAIIIQKYWRGYLVRHSPHYAKHAKVFDEIRRGIKEDKGRIIIQSVIRTFLILHRLQHLTQAAYTMQKFLIPKLLRIHMYDVHECIIRIQSWWRGNRVRRILQEEKLKCILSKEKVLADRKTCRECAVAMEIMQIKERYGLAIEGLQLVHVTASIEGKEVYPYDWAEGIRRLLTYAASSSSPSCPSSSSSSSSPSSSYSISHVAIGAFHTILVTRGGYIYTYGLNDCMQLGCTYTTKGIPLPIYPIKGIKQPLIINNIYCGVDYSLILTQQGHVYAWGDNKYGQCGCAPRSVCVSSPTRVRFMHPKENKEGAIIKTLGVGGYHNGAIDEEGRLYMWGRSSHIHLQGIISDVPLPLWITLPELLEGPPLVSIHCSINITYIIRKDNKVYVFGKSTEGQLGLGQCMRSTRIPTNINIYSGVRTLQTGINFTLAINTQGQLFLWGSFLLWKETEEVCIKAQSFEPIRIDIQSILGKNKEIKEIGIGWWEGILLFYDGTIAAWNFIQQFKDGVLIPALYEYELAIRRQSRHLCVVSSPLLCAVFAEFINNNNKKKKGEEGEGEEEEEEEEEEGEEEEKEKEEKIHKKYIHNNYLLNNNNNTDTHCYPNYLQEGFLRQE